MQHNLLRIIIFLVFFLTINCIYRGRNSLRAGFNEEDTDYVNDSDLEGAWTASTVPALSNSRCNSPSYGDVHRVCDPDNILSPSQRFYLQRKLIKFSEDVKYTCTSTRQQLYVPIIAYALKNVKKTSEGQSPEQAAAQFGRSVFEYSDLIHSSNCENLIVLVYIESTGASAVVFHKDIYSVIPPNLALFVEKTISSAGSPARSWSAHLPALIATKSTGLSEAVAIMYDHVMGSMIWTILFILLALICIPILIIQIVTYLTFRRLNAHYNKIKNENEKGDTFDTSSETTIFDSEGNLLPKQKQNTDHTEIAIASPDQTIDTAFNQ